MVRFFLIFGGVELALSILPLSGYQEWLAESLGGMFSIAARGIFIPVSTGAFEITPFCTGFTSAALFAGLLYGFRKMPPPANSLNVKLEKIPSTPKLLYLFGGTLFLLVINYVRLVLVIATGLNFSLESAEWVHVISWFVLSGVTFGMWIFILRRETGVSNLRALARRLL